MTVAARVRQSGLLLEVIEETGLETDAPQIAFSARTGTINADLTIGADLASARPIRANEGLCSRGVSLHGVGFIVTPAVAEHLGLGRRPGLEKHIRLYRNGRDLMSHPRQAMVIDLFGLTADEVRSKFPELYQHIVLEVKEKKTTLAS